MRMASGRGQSHFNVTDFLEPFLQNLELVHYPLNHNTSNAYYDMDEALDRTSYLPICSYATDKKSSNCKLFEPVVTDLGICYSFNAESMTSMLTNSSFKEAFSEAYKYDLLEIPTKNALGAGDTFALKFMLDNSRYLRKKPKTNPFKILISSRNGYFDAFSSAIEVKPGYETTLSIQPVEVVGTDGLRNIPITSR